MPLLMMLVVSALLPFSFSLLPRHASEPHARRPPLRSAVTLLLCGADFRYYCCREALATLAYAR